MTASPSPRTPTSTPILRRALTLGTILTLAIAVVGALVGLIVSGTPGLVGGVLGGVIAAVFLGVTALSILIANRFVESPLYTTLFFVIVLGAWIVKFVLFIVIVSLLRNQTWLDPIVLLLTLIASVIASLIVDVVVVARSRLPYASDVTLPGDNSDGSSASSD